MNSNFYKYFCILGTRGFLENIMANIFLTKYSKAIEFLILNKKSGKRLLNNNKCSSCEMYALLKKNKILMYANHLLKKRNPLSNLK